MTDSVQTCVYCGTVAGPFQLDHVVPRSRGGPNHPRNLIDSCAKCNGEKGNRLPSEWLGAENVPPLVAAIEARVCATIEVRVRGKRGLSSVMMSVKLTCDVCSKDVADAYRKDKDAGWLSWWVDRTDVVQCIHVSCAGDCCRRLTQWYRPHLVQMDNHLQMFAGEYALPQMWRLFRDHPRWSDDARERLIEIFWPISKLSTDESVRECME